MNLQLVTIVALALLAPAALAHPQGFRNQQPKGRRFESQQNRFDQRVDQPSAGDAELTKSSQDGSGVSATRFAPPKRGVVVKQSNMIWFEQQSNDNNQQFDGQQQFNNDQFQRNDNQKPNFRPQPQNDNFRRETTTFIPIIRFDKEQTIDGSYKTSWETGNNIVAEETGVLKQFGGENQDAVVQQGSFSYTSPEGTLITVQYTADEQGFRASGDHLPTPPPIPEEIQKSLDIIYAGIKQQEQQQQREGRNQQFQSSSNSNNQYQFQQQPQQQQQQQQQQQSFQEPPFQNDDSGNADFIKPQQNANNNINFRNGGGERVAPNRRGDFRQSPRGFRQ